MLQIGKYDSTKVPTIIGQFCQNHKLVEVEIFASTADMEKRVKDKILSKLSIPFFKTLTQISIKSKGLDKKLWMKSEGLSWYLLPEVRLC